jgi:hypothetical protein
MIDVVGWDKVHAYVNGCFEYIATEKGLRDVVDSAIVMAAPYIRRDAVLEACENLHLPEKHRDAYYPAVFALSMFATRVFREATSEDIPDETQEAIEGIERVVKSLEYTLTLPGSDEAYREQAAEWIERLSIRSFNLRGLRNEREM